MRRFKIGVAYVGHAFSGFSANSEAQLPAVQNSIELALSKISPFSNFQVSSRTDAGVHALRNVFHVDLAAPTLTAQTVPHAINYHLSQTGAPPISITDAEEVDSSFDARLSCTGRTYIYRVISPLPASETSTTLTDTRLHPSLHLFHQHHAWVLPRPIDLDIMRRASVHLLGEQNFAAFRNSGCQSHSSHRKVTQVDIHEHSPPTNSGHEVDIAHDPLAHIPGGRLVVFTISANAFLLRQVSPRFNAASYHTDHYLHNFIL